MENFYTAYRKTIDGVTFYFVKKYQTFPEYKGVPSILENYGMHTDFKKACKIAMINSREIQQQLLDSIENKSAQTKVVQINRVKAESRSYKMWPKTFTSTLRMFAR